MSSKNERELLTKYMKEDLGKWKADLDEEDCVEISEDIKDELLALNVLKKKKLPMPLHNTIISTESDGVTPLSYFSQDEWVFSYTGILIALIFVKKIKSFNLLDPLAEPLRCFHKYILYFFVPGKNPYVTITSPRTAVSINYKFQFLLEFIYKNGYLLGANGIYKTLETLSVEVVQREIISRIEADEGVQRVVYLAESISRWAFVSQIAELPPEFRAPFTVSQFWANGLSEKVACYAAKYEEIWKAIEFEDLQRLLKKGIIYLEKYSRDIILIKKSLHEVNKIAENVGYSNPSNIIIGTNQVHTRKTAVKLLSHKFFEEEKDGNLKPWFNVSTRRYKGKNFDIIMREPLNLEIERLLGASIFMLLLWTAMRIGELLLLKSTALIIDGRPLDVTKDAINQVGAGTRFQIIRTVPKTSKNYYGDSHPRPITRLGALAFAVIHELLRQNRETLSNEYLFPIGGLSGRAHQRKRVKISSHLSDGAVRSYLRAFCSVAEVESIFPHQCRKTLPTLMINHDPLCLELIRDILCHKSIAMTMVYIMSLPGVSEDAMRIIFESECEAMIELFADIAEGKVAGPKGNEILDMVFAGEVSPTSAKSFLDAYIESNLAVFKSPAAWCLRYPSKVSWNAPCLPPQETRTNDVILWPNPDRCIPWRCKYPLHTSRDLSRAKGNLSWAKKSESGARSSASKESYGVEAAYWERVVQQLEVGRQDIVELRIVENFLAQRGAA